MNKNYNSYTKQYRFIKCDLSDPDILSIVFCDDYKYDTCFVPKNYNPYFLWLFWWFLLRFPSELDNLKHNKSIKYIIKYFIIPVAVILAATIIYEIWIKDLIIKN
jgi:hypothetical protein